VEDDCDDVIFSFEHWNTAFDVVVQLHPFVVFYFDLMALYEATIRL